MAKRIIPRFVSVEIQEQQGCRTKAALPSDQKVLQRTAHSLPVCQAGQASVYAKSTCSRRLALAGLLAMSVRALLASSNGAIRARLTLWTPRYPASSQFRLR
jgi:hypothetical protein